MPDGKKVENIRPRLAEPAPDDLSNEERIAAKYEQAIQAAEEEAEGFPGLEAQGTIPKEELKKGYEVQAQLSEHEKKAAEQQVRDNTMYHDEREALAREMKAEPKELEEKVSGLEELQHEADVIELQLKKMEHVEKNSNFVVKTFSKILNRVRGTEAKLQNRLYDIQRQIEAITKPGQPVEVEVHPEEPEIDQQTIEEMKEYYYPAEGKYKKAQEMAENFDYTRMRLEQEEAERGESRNEETISNLKAELRAMTQVIDELSAQDKDWAGTYNTKMNHDLIPKRLEREKEEKLEAAKQDAEFFGEPVKPEVNPLVAQREETLKALLKYGLSKKEYKAALSGQATDPAVLDKLANMKSGIQHEDRDRPFLVNQLKNLEKAINPPEAVAEEPLKSEVEQKAKAKEPAIKPEKVAAIIEEYSQPDRAEDLAILLCNKKAQLFAENIKPENEKNHPLIDQLKSELAHIKKAAFDISRGQPEEQQRLKLAIQEKSALLAAERKKPRKSRSEEKISSLSAEITALTDALNKVPGPNNVWLTRYQNAIDRRQEPKLTADKMTTVRKNMEMTGQQLIFSGEPLKKTAERMRGLQDLYDQFAWQEEFKGIRQNRDGKILADIIITNAALTDDPHFTDRIVAVREQVTRLSPRQQRLFHEKIAAHFGQSLDELEEAGEDEPGMQTPASIV